MAIDYDKLHNNLEEKVNEGSAQLLKVTIGDEHYAMLLKDITDTLTLLNSFKQAATPSKVNVGDPFKSFGDYNDDVTRIVVFSRNNCDFCKAMSPVYLPVMKEEKIPYELINTSVPDEGAFAEKLGITGVPYFLFIKNAKVVHTLEGYDTSKKDIQNKEAFRVMIKKYLKDGE